MLEKLDFSKSYTQNWAKQSTNLFVGDLIGTAAEVAAIASMRKFERKYPKTTGFIVDSLNVPMTYFQPQIEKVLSYTKNFEGEEYYNKRLQKSPEERARSYAEGLFRYGAAWGVGWATTVGSEQLVLSKVLNTPKVPPKFYFMDFAMHAGLITLMGTPFVKPATEKAKDVIKAVAGTMGADEQQAEDISRLTVVTAIPNYTVFGIVSSQLYKHHKGETSKLGALAEQLGIGSNLSHVK